MSGNAGVISRTSVCALFVLPFLCSCATLTSMNPFAARGSEIQPLQETPEGHRLVLVEWRSSAGTSGDFDLVPAQFNEASVVASKDGLISRIDAGRTVWTTRVDAVISGAVAANQDIVVAGTSRADLIAFGMADGVERWRAKAGSEILAVPSLTGNIVIAKSGDSKIWAFDQRTGKQLWTYQRSNPPLSLRSSAGVEVDGDKVFAGFPGGKLVALAISDGRVLWESAISTPKGATELERMTDVAGLPQLAGSGHVCAVAFQGSVTCLDAKTGATSWSRPTSSTVGIGVNSATVYVAADDGSVSSYDSSTGALRWRTEVLKGREPTRPIPLGDYVAVMDGAGYLHLLDQKSGTVVALKRVATGSTTSVPVGTDKLLIQARIGEVVMVRLGKS